MNRHITLKIIAASLLLLTSGASRAMERYYDQARVVGVTPEYERISVPREECYDESAPSPRTYPRSSECSYGGSIIGGITGALVGNQIGRGHGREAATAFGAITGAIVGDRLQNQHGDTGWEPRPLRHCHDIEQWENRITGYRVMYEYGGRRHTTLMSTPPGNTVRVRVSVDAYED